MGEKRGDNTSIVCTVTVSSVNTLNSTHIDIATGGGGGGGLVSPSFSTS